MKDINLKNYIRKRFKIPACTFGENVRIRKSRDLIDIGIIYLLKFIEKETNLTRFNNIEKH